jgi:hypothetical protein
MTDTDKIVAAILAAAHSRKSSEISPEDYVETYLRMLAELEIAEKRQVGDFAGSKTPQAKRSGKS